MVAGDCGHPCSCRAGLGDEIPFGSEPYLKQEAGLMGRNSKAFTFVELTFIILVLAVMAYVAVPRLQFAGLYRQQADTVARNLVTDLRLTRTLAISYAASNVEGYGLSMNGTAPGPYTGYEIINLDTSDIVDSRTIDSKITCTGGNDFRFGPLGNLLNGSDNQLSVSAYGKSFTITVVIATGTVKCVED
jgi:Tfp pilus assembly protein FimT